MSAKLVFEVKKGLAGFELEAGAALRPGITALFGPSGAGKTTLLNLLSGIETPDEGAIAFGETHFFNSVMKVNLPPEKRKIGYVFQDDQLFPHYTVLENLNFGRARGMERQGLSKIVEIFGLRALLNRRPNTLSGGEKKRVAIARALLSDPDILLLDEPLANIDGKRREAFFPFLEAMKREFSMPIVYVSHQLDEVLRLADDLAVIDQGRLLESGPLAEVFGSRAFQVSLPHEHRGVLLAGTVSKIEGGLAEIDIPGATLFAGSTGLKEGDGARIRLLAKDVAIALKKPQNISILNALPCTILENRRTLSGQIELDLEVTGGKTRIKAEVTAKSALDLKLKNGLSVYALIKALAIISPG